MAKRSIGRNGGTLHQQIVADILRDWPAACTHGFWKAMRSLPDADYVTELLADDPDWRAWVKFIPDAWMINPTERHVVVFEAVDTHDISPLRFAKMSDFSWALDEDYYDLVLIRCDRWGRSPYHVQMAGLASMLDEINRGIPDDHSWRVTEWANYTVPRVCAAVERESVCKQMPFNSFLKDAGEVAHFASSPSPASTGGEG